MIKNILKVAILCMGYCSLAQNLPNIIPSSPNVSSIEKYLETPVGLATGVPDIQIPLYTIKERDISVPISLSYHAGGIKVEEVASWVGQGWSLNSGGMVSRIVKGLPDDNSNGIINSSLLIDDIKSMPSNSVTLQDILTDAMNGLVDLEPDEFSFNFLGISGTFFYDQDEGGFIQRPYSNIKITPQINGLNGSIEGWVFIDPDGMKYYFGKDTSGLKNAKETNTVSISHTIDRSTGEELLNHNYIPDHNVGWYLLEIVSPLGSKVMFNYTEQISNLRTYSLISESQIVESCTSESSKINLVSSFQNEINLESIEFSEGKIEFELEQSKRLDKDSKALKRISLINSNHIYKQFNFNYFYSTSNPETGILASFGDSDKRTRRLFLDSIEVEGQNNSQLPPYSFVYNDPNGLPSRFSYAQDFWGYYNGQNSNSSLLPRIKTFAGFIQGNAERFVDSLYSKKGILTKIIYPTGGYTEYFYESNTASDVLAGSNGYDPNFLNLITKNMAYNLRNKPITQEIVFNKIPENVDSNPNYSYSKNFSIPVSNIGDVSVTSFVTGCDNFNNGVCDYYIEIKGITNPSFYFAIGTSSNSNSNSVNMPAGDYKIVAIDDPFSQAITTGPVNFNIVLSYMNDPNPDYSLIGGIPTFYNIGGLRKKKIIASNSEDTVLEKNYEYHIFGENTSSGKVIFPPLYYDNQIWNGNCSPGNYVTKITSYSQTNLFKIKGSSLSYHNVTEYIGQDLKIEYSYSYGHSFPGSYNLTFGEVFLPLLDINWQNGGLLKKQDFKKIDSNNYSIVQNSEYSYSSYGYEEFENSGVKIIPTIGSETFKYGYYGNVSEWYRLKNTTTTNYFDSGNVVSTITHDFDNNPLLPSKTKSTTSNGFPLIKLNYYADDIISTSYLLGDNLTTSEKSAIDMLKKEVQHRIANPIQTEMYLDKNNNNIAEVSELISLNRINYKDWDSELGLPMNTDLILSKDTQALKGVYNSSTNVLENMIVFSVYDVNGNVMEVSKEDGKHIIYVWGYNHQYPIAKIENATYSSGLPTSILQNQQTLINEAVTSSNLDTSENNENLLRIALQNLRIAFPNSMVTTFTYDLLIGVTSITDPNGSTVYYNYDDFNRLDEIRDDTNKLMNDYKYHYKTSN